MKSQTVDFSILKLPKTTCYAISSMHSTTQTTVVCSDQLFKSNYYYYYYNNFLSFVEPKTATPPPHAAN